MAQNWLLVRRALEVLPHAAPDDSQLQRQLAKIEAELDRRGLAAKLAA